MSISLKHNIRPAFPIARMNCDDGLDSRLNMYSLTSLMNSHECTVLCGAPKSGKTSLLWGFFKHPKLLKKVFHNIYIFQPTVSGESMKDNIFSCLPDNQRFDKLNYDDLSDVLERITNSEKWEENCVIFDDQAAYLKQKSTRTLFEELVYNRRHLRTNIFFLTQGWKKIPLDLRKVFSNIFLFKVAKKELYIIWDEAIEENVDLVPKISKLVFDKKHNFLFVNVESKRMFKNWDEILISDPDDDDDVDVDKEKICA